MNIMKKHLFSKIILSLAVSALFTLPLSAYDSGRGSYTPTPCSSNPRGQWGNEHSQHHSFDRPSRELFDEMDETDNEIDDEMSNRMYDEMHDDMDHSQMQSHMNDEMHDNMDHSQMQSHMHDPMYNN